MQSDSKKLESLDIRNNQIDSFADIDHLAKLGVNSLKIQHNPLYNTDYSNFERIRARVVSCIPTLISLNGSRISKQDREDAELLYISIAREGINSVTFKKDFPRIEELCQTYDRNLLDVESNTSILKTNLIAISFDIDNAPGFTKSFPPKTTIRIVRQILMKRLKCPAKNICMKYEDNESHVIIELTEMQESLEYYISDYEAIIHVYIQN